MMTLLINGRDLIGTDPCLLLPISSDTVPQLEVCTGHRLGLAAQHFFHAATRYGHVIVEPALYFEVRRRAG